MSPATKTSTKITFVGAGSTVFAKNIIGDALLLESLQDAHVALYDIDAQRLEESKLMIDAINANANAGRATITAHLGVGERRQALEGASYVVNAVQVGGYEPCTVTDFEIPKRYGLQQTIGDTLGIGGIFRTLRTLPVLLDVAGDMEAVCSDAWLLNYTNPMAAITSGALRGSSIRTVGLCHSVQSCVRELLRIVGLSKKYRPDDVRWEIAGINHQSWLLGIEHDGVDISGEVEQAARARVDRLRQRGEPGEWVRDLARRLDLPEERPNQMISWAADQAAADGVITREEYEDAMVAVDLVRLEFLFRFGHYVTESSEHNAEYTPWFIKQHRPELLDHWNIPIDEYPRRCRIQIANWERQRDALVNDPSLGHTATNEFGAYIMDAIETDTPYRIAGNVANDGLITNLPRKACVEVPCLVDGNGVQPTIVGDLPEQCAAMNRTNINPQILSVEAVLTGSKDLVYQAALLDPHTSAELTIDETVRLCDDLFEAHEGWLPTLV